MKRLVLIAALVLIPFAGLIALGFSLMTEPLPIVLPAQVVQLPPPPIEPPPEPIRPVAPMPPPLPVDVQVVAPPPLEAAPPAAELSAQAKRVPMIAAVEPLVQQCFRDISERVREPMKVTVGFNATAEGGFDSIVIKKASWPDPHLAACVIDSFEEARFEPGGLPLRRQTHTFTFGAPDGG